MKATEGAFINWAFEVAKEPEFEGRIITEGEPEKGNTLVLSIDVRIQRIAYEVFRASLTKAKYSGFALTTL